MGSRYRCRVSPSGVPGCTAGTGGTGATGEEATFEQSAGSLGLVVSTDLVDGDPGEFIDITGAWLPGDLGNFTDMGDGVLRYDGADERLFQISGHATFETDPEAEDTVNLTYSINGDSQAALVVGEAFTTGGNSATASLAHTALLASGDLVRLMGATSSGVNFTINAASLSVSAAGG